MKDRAITVTFLIFLGGLLMQACAKQTVKEELPVTIAPVWRDREAIVTIMSDDGFYNTGVCLNELSKDYGIRVTISGSIGAFVEHKKEWQQMEKDGSIEIISHSYTHTKMSEEANLSDKELKHEIQDSIKYCSKNFNTSQIVFTPPENVMCERGYELLKESGIYAMRQGGRGLNSLSPSEGTEGGDWYNLLTHGIYDVETTEERNAWIEDAVNEKAWLIEMWHNVTEAGDQGGYQEIAVDLAKEHLAYVVEKEKEEKIWIAPITDATKYLYERQRANVRAVYGGAEITVELQCDISGKNKREFDFPLTIKIRLPQTLDNCNNFYVNGEILQVIDDGENRYVMLDMVPNETCRIRF